MAKVMIDPDLLREKLEQRKLSTGRLIQWQYAIDEAEVEVEDVVYCQECDSYDNGFCEMLNYVPDNEYFFCAFGERREDSGEDKKHG